jgi:hypothetical protein
LYRPPLFWFVAALIAVIATRACAAENETIVPKSVKTEPIWPPPQTQTLPNPPSSLGKTTPSAPQPKPTLVPKGHYARPYLPPVDLDHPFKGILTVRRLSEDDIVKVCESRWWLKYPTHIACAYPFGQNGVHCLVYMANDDVLKAYGQDAASTLRHEIGHCNGWGRDHERGRNPDGTARK